MVVPYILLGCVASLAMAAPQFPMEGDMSIVFPQNDTYGVTSPFPVVFAFRNAPALLSWDSQLQWDIECEHGNLYGTGQISGHDGATLPSEPFFAVNTSTPIWERVEGSTSTWFFLDGVDHCTFKWNFGFSSTCHTFPNGTTELRLGDALSKGEFGFTLKLGGNAPIDVLSNYKGCPGKGASRKVVSAEICPELEPPKDPEPCSVDVKSAMSTFISNIPTATTTFLGSTSSTSTSKTKESSAPTETGEGGGSDEGSGGGEGSGSSTKDSSAVPFGDSASLSFLVFIGYLVAL